MQLPLIYHRRASLPQCPVVVPLALGDLELDGLPVDVPLTLPLLPLLADTTEDAVGKASVGVAREEGECMLLREACPEGVVHTVEVLVGVAIVLAFAAFGLQVWQTADTSDD